MSPPRRCPVRVGSSSGQEPSPGRTATKTAAVKTPRPTSEFGSKILWPASEKTKISFHLPTSATLCPLCVSAVSPIALLFDS
jgi:hypothetical protein